ncbi:DsbA family protein [Sanguibacter sp. HDW7]|uniref:DsbA family oxidoreductase n=1 Tax=Sanguibacter sp. HDW7 TaxID=2714931 RepID=UPI0014085B7C|nr:DsbA family oxidoreductase [Sanguibacter sp. HDW7]QIK82343.1 DsbA family oxidoreductase [Sanguibacter sp. HDW7]
MSTQPAAAEPLKIDIWSDIACPWCYLGKHRLAAGIEAFAATDAAVPVEIEYHSFELAPDTPEDFEGSEIDFLSHHKGMPAAKVEQMLGQMTEMAASEGLTMDFARLRHTKTLRAHELLHAAKAAGLQPEMLERLYEAYFAQGEHVADVDTLVRLATEVGLDGDDVRAALADERHADAVEADIEQARAFGITGVPFFVIDGRYGISGAQPGEAFAQILGQIVAERAAADA